MARLRPEFFYYQFSKITQLFLQLIKSTIAIGKSGEVAQQEVGVQQEVSGCYCTVQQEVSGWYL
jgi:hypothetical protein